MPVVKSKRNKAVIVVSVAVFWLVMNAQLVRRELFLTRLPSGSTSLAASLTPETSFKEQWMGIYYEGEKIGYSNTTVNRMYGSQTPGFLILNRTFMTLTLMDNPLKVNFEGVLHTDENFKMRTFTCRLKSAGHEIQLDGKRAGDLLTLDVLSGGRVFRKTANVSEDVNLSNSLTPLLYLPDLKPGVTYSVQILDPFTLATNTAKVTVTGMEPYDYEGKKIDVYVVDTKYEGLTFTAWVTEGGETLKESTPLGWTLVREDRTVAQDFPMEDTRVPYDLAKKFAVPSDVHIEEPESARRMEAAITGIDLDQFKLDGAYQKLTDRKQGLLRVDMVKADPAQSITIPVTGKEFTEALSPTVFIQSDDQAIRNLATEIAGGETNALIVAERINQWLFENINKKITFSLPSAVEVLKTREGDCNEHTTLFVALARSLGLPSKIAIGLVYHKGNFYYHAWPEVYVGRWVAMDPTLGESLADATHIKLLEGDLEQQAKLMQIIGKIKLSIRSVSYDKA
jgi:transglutaminase-like putative cysteine protease